MANPYENVKTEGLSGYAAAYANAVKSGKSDAEAHTIANATVGGSGLTQSDVSNITKGSTTQQTFTPNTYNPSYAASSYDDSGYSYYASQQQPQQQAEQQRVVYQADPSIAAAINDLRSSMANMPTIDDIMSSPAMQQMQAAIQGQMADAMRGARADLAARGVLGEGSTPAAERMGQVAGHYGTQLGQLVPQLMSVAQQMSGDRTNALQNLVSILSGLSQQDWQRGMTEFQTYAPYTRLTAGQRAELANMLLMNVPALQGYSPDMIMQWLDTI